MNAGSPALRTMSAAAIKVVVSGLHGRAGVANGTYCLVPGEVQHRRPVYLQLGVRAGRGASRLVYDKTPGEPPAWMVELPDDPGKAYAYCEDRAQSPDATRELWHVWHCALTLPIERGEWRVEPSFRVVKLEERPEPVLAMPPRTAPAGTGPRPVSRVQAPASIRIRNHPYAEYNGEYARAGECEGYPYYSSRTGKHLFRPVGFVPDLEQWLLSSALKPRENLCESYIECPDASPPLGSRRWSVWMAALQHWSWQQLELTEDHVAGLGSSARERQLHNDSAPSIRMGSVAEPHAGTYEDFAHRTRVESSGFNRTNPAGGATTVTGAGGDGLGRTMSGELVRTSAGFNRTIPPGGATTVAGAGGDGLTRTLSGELVRTSAGPAGRSGTGTEEDEEALATSMSLETQVEDDRRRELRRRIAAEDAIAMGFDAELVASVQAQGKYDTVDGLVEKLAELTRDHIEPEPEREDDYSDDAAVYDSACALDLKLAGLPNPSNYCFLNATVQCLRHTPGFASMLSSALGDKAGSKFRGRPATLLEAFVLLLRRMEDGQQRPVLAKSREWEGFIAQCKEQLPSEPDEDGRLTTLVHLNRQPQQDAGEFLLQLLDQLSQDRVGGSAKNRLVLERQNSQPVIALEPNYGDKMAARLTRAKSSPEAERRLLDEYIEKQWRATKDTTRRTKLGALFQGQELTYKLCNKPGCGLFSPSSADPVLVEELHCSHLARRDRATLDELLRSSSEAETPEDFACDNCKAKGTTTMARVLVRLPKVSATRVAPSLPSLPLPRVFSLSLSLSLSLCLSLSLSLTHSLSLSLSLSSRASARTCVCLSLSFRLPRACHCLYTSVLLQVLVIRLNRALPDDRRVDCSIEFPVHH